MKLWKKTTKLPHFSACWLEILYTFGLVFLEFWSWFSLDFTLFGLEMKVGALVMPYSLNLCSTARSLLSCSLPTPCAQTSSFIWVGMGCIFKFAKTFNYGATDEQIFLAATSSWRSDDVTLSVCLSACLLVCHLIFLAVNFAPLHFSPLNLCNTCTFQHLHLATLATTWAKYWQNSDQK